MGTEGRISRLTLRTQPDDRLVRLVRDGHEPAFEEIVRRYRAPLVRFAATIVPAHGAEDAVQEALVRAQAALVADDAEISLRAWLYTIVRNGAVSERRKIRPTEELDETINGVPRPPEIVERREEVRGVIARLKVLPAPQREALVRTELGGESAQEIASALGTTTGAVGQLVFRARAALRSGAAVVLPMPVLRLLLSAPPGGGTGATATGGLVASTLGGGGGGIAVKVGAAVVVAAIAVGPGRAPVGDGGERGGAVEIGGVGGGAEVAEAATGGGGGDAGATDTDRETAPDAGGRAAAPTGASGAGEGDGGSGGEATTQTLTGGQIDSGPAEVASGTPDDGGGSAPSSPQQGGGHHDGGGSSGGDPGVPDSGGYGGYGGHDGGSWDGGGQQAYSGHDGGYGDDHGGGDHGGYGGHHGGHP